MAIHSYTASKAYNFDTLLLVIKEIEIKVKAKYENWVANTSNYGTISQLMNLVTNFAYNIKVMQIGENSFTKRDITGEAIEVRISKYGFDVNKHMQLARGLQMKAIEASTQKTSLGYAATIVHYHEAPTSQMKAKWVPAIEYHLTGLPRKNDILQIVLRDDHLARAVNAILGDIFLLIGDRAKHRFGIPPGYLFELFNVNGEYDENRIRELNFSSPSILKLIHEFNFTIPTTIAVEKVKFLIVMSIFEGMYEDLGIITQVATVQEVEI